ncbi:MAG: patatin-like phospholipase family protein [Pseudomonadota bacterium]|nr:patatin-like phospholipase family protein [Pseudomonadota bacterium]
MLLSDVRQLLRRCAMFGHMEPAANEALARELVWLGLPGGRPLFKSGEAADALYLLRSGSLGVFEDGPSADAARLVHLIAAGEVVGAVSLLGDGRRSRTVRALRDSELLRLDRGRFEALLERFPRALLGVGRCAIEWLQQRHRGDQPPGLPRTFALLPHDPEVPARVLAMQLAQALEAHGHCSIIDARQGHGRGADWFAEHESRQRFVIYLDTHGDPLWRQRCIRQADVLLLPALAARPAGAWPEAELLEPRRSGHRARHLLLLHAGHRVSLGAAQRWRAPFSGELQHHHLCHRDDMARLARLVSGHGRGLVLAGGGARGLAHLGMLRALHEAGHAFDAVGGTSIGAIIGAGLACGWSLEAITDTLRRGFVEGRPLSDWTLPLVAMTRGRRASAMLRQAFGALEIEDLPLPYFCISTQLSGGGMAVHRQGPLWLWLRASSAIPGVLPPVQQHGRVYVDGALVDNLPTDVMAADGIAHITALDIRADIALRTSAEESSTPPLWRLLLQRRQRILRPGLVSTLVRAGMVNGETASAARRERADLLITPPLEHLGMLDWKDWQRAIDAGYRHTVHLLESGRAESGVASSNLSSAAHSPRRN